MKTRDKVLATIEDYIQEHGYAPSVADLARLTRLASTSAAHYHLRKLEEAGRIKRTPNTARSIIVLDTSP